MKTSAVVFAAALSLAACSPKADDGSASTEPAAAPAAAPAPAPAAVADCKTADHAPVYAGAKVSVCTQGEALGKTSGTAIFTTADAPATVAAFYKEHVTKAGMMVMDMTSDPGAEVVFTAHDSSAAKKTMRLAAKPDGTGSAVTLNWGEVR